MNIALRHGDFDEIRISKQAYNLLADHQEPPLGSHLVTPRRGYLHHGIHVGGRQVVHYAGLAHGLRGGPVEEVSLARFARGQLVWMRTCVTSEFDVPEVICRARSRVGEDCYRLLTNNCEHFCTWALRDETRSSQIKRVLALPRQLIRRLTPSNNRSSAPLVMG